MSDIILTRKVPWNHLVEILIASNSLTYFFLFHSDLAHEKLILSVFNP